jgi:hypothetical protein
MIIERMLFDQTFEWAYPHEGTSDMDRSGQTLIFYLEKTEPRGPHVPPTDTSSSLVEVGRTNGPAKGSSVSVTVDPGSLGLTRGSAKNRGGTRYEMSVKVDDSGTERTLEEGLLFVFNPRVKTNVT